MLDALADAVITKVRDGSKKKSRVEGSPRDGWLLLDYGAIIVHLFAPELRKYYRLEELWKMGKVLLHLQ